MSLFGPSQVTGDIVQLRRTSPLHLDSAGQTGPLTKPKEGGFGSLLLNALNGVNNATQKSLSLEQQAIVDPKSVNAHDITIALAEANMAVSITKAVADRVIQAYQSIINMR